MRTRAPGGVWDWDGKFRGTQGLFILLSAQIHFGDIHCTIKEADEGEAFAPGFTVNTKE
jgi:hypothetical protein